jgi:stage II sporulation protein P
MPAQRKVKVSGVSSNRKRVPRGRAAVLLILAALCAAAGFAAAHGSPGALSRLPWLGDAVAVKAGHADLPDERLDGLHFTIYSEQGQMLLQTGWMVTVDDEYVDEGNRHWRVVSVEGDRATAVQIGMFSLEIDHQHATAEMRGAAARSWLLPAVAAPQTASIAVYHTHGDESYVPGDGTDSKPRGGIMDVGAQLVQTMQAQGATVQHNRSRHAPHDSGAYRRSRRTAASLIRQGSGTLLDVHRDAAPRAAYETEVDGQPASRVMLVVGRANPQMQTTLNFARSFKRTLDEQHPNLMRGIFFGRGSYNQDLSPRAMLLEIGSHRTPKEHALRTATIVGRAMPAVLGFAGTPGAGAEQASRANLGWIALIVALGAAVYLVVASGGWKQALAKLQGFTRREFASSLVPRKVGARRPRLVPSPPAGPGQQGVAERRRAGAAAARDQDPEGSEQEQRDD